MQIKIAETSAQIRACFPVMVQLRPHYTADQFVAQVQLQAQEVGYQLVYVEGDAEVDDPRRDSAQVVAVAGFVVRHMLSAGHVLYVDDLVTDVGARSHGYGAALMAWLDDYARQAGCDVLDLDSGVQRAGAHRFYFREGMHIFAYHFRRPLALSAENG
ncbi:MAG: GNAT family N-acetyltransferase [Litorilinea sp.]